MRLLHSNHSFSILKVLVEVLTDNGDNILAVNYFYGVLFLMHDVLMGRAGFLSVAVQLI